MNAPGQSEESLALFPLRAVLFPGGLLPLRIFEPRYVDMVGRCLREHSPFGVLLIRDGGETGAIGALATVGSSARIVDFQTLPDGLLGLMCRGERRFELLGRQQQSDGLHVGAVRWLASPRVALPEAYRALGQVLERVLPALGAARHFLEQDLGSAGWVADRLAELLPLSAEQQQCLLEIADPLARLASLEPLIDTAALTPPAPPAS